MPSVATEHLHYFYVLAIPGLLVQIPSFVYNTKMIYRGGMINSSISIYEVIGFAVQVWDMRTLALQARSTDNYHCNGGVMFQTWCSHLFVQLY